MPADDFVVTPWNVEGDIDYDKLIKRFGTQKITPDLLSKIEKFGWLEDKNKRKAILNSPLFKNVINIFSKKLKNDQ